MWKMSGLRVKRMDKTLFVPLPKDQQAPINGGCDCRFCKTHPEATPMWDTMALSIDGSHEHTWTVHFPELAPVCRVEGAAFVHLTDLPTKQIGVNNANLIRSRFA